MVTPTHIQLTVLRARGLLCKGKHGTNDAFVGISFGKEKTQTTTRERASTNETVEWNEGFELAIPQGQQKPELILTVYHRKIMGGSFLGSVTFPSILNEYNPSNTPKNTWHTLKGKLGEDDGEARGELELKIWILRKSPGLNDTAIQNGMSNSMGSMTSVGPTTKTKTWGGMIQVGKAKNKWTNNVMAKRQERGVAMHTLVRPQRVMSVRNNHRNSDPGVLSSEDSDDGESKNPYNQSAFILANRNARIEEEVELDTSSMNGGSPIIDERPRRIPKITRTNSETSEEIRKAISPQSNRTRYPSDPCGSESPSSLSSRSNLVPLKKKEPIPKPRIIPETAIALSDLMNGGSDSNNNSSTNINKMYGNAKDFSKIASPGFFGGIFNKQSSQTPIGVTNPIQNGHGNSFNDFEDSGDDVPDEVLRRFDGKSKEDVIGMLLRLQSNHEQKNRRIDELENYIANMILKILESGQPELLQKKEPFATRFNRSGKFSL